MVRCLMECLIFTVAVRSVLIDYLIIILFFFFFTASQLLCVCLSLKATERRTSRKNISKLSVFIFSNKSSFTGYSTGPYMKFLTLTKWLSLDVLNAQIAP